MASLGRIEEFSGENNNSWEEYAERLECFFDANDITGEEKKRSILLTVCGAATYSTLRSLVAPRKPKEVPYADLLKTLNEHLIQHLLRLCSAFISITVNRSLASQ